MKLCAQLLAILAALLYVSGEGQTRPPVPREVFRAVHQTFPTRRERIQAFDVAYCESRFWPYARNGQYLGLFQFGSWARAEYGWGWGLWAQTRAAYRYYVASGRDWSPWECKPRRI